MAEKRIYTSDRRTTVRATRPRRASDVALHNRAKTNFSNEVEFGRPRGKVNMQMAMTKTPQRSSGYFKGFNEAGGSATRQGNRAFEHILTGEPRAEKYLASKAAQAAAKPTAKAFIKPIARAASRVGGLAATAAELGLAVVELTKLKHQEREAKLGTKMLKSGMRSAKLKKSLSKNREGIPSDIKVN